MAEGLSRLSHQLDQRKGAETANARTACRHPDLAEGADE
jgi:hypothetical protein